MNILLIGSPGSGKGTQAQKLITKKNFKHLSTGDIFRKNLKEQTTLGSKVQKYLNKGQLVPDEVTIQMVQHALKDISTDTSLIFDGFPRNIIQAQALDQMLQKRSQKLDFVFYIKVPDLEVIDRLTGRLWAPKSGRIYHQKTNPPKVMGFCDQTGEALVSRTDDTQEVILARLKIFWDNTHPLLNYFQKQSRLHTIDGTQSPEKVFEDILSVLKKIS